MNVYTNRTLDGDWVSEHKNKKNAIKAAKQEKDTAYVEFERIDKADGTCFYSETVWSKDFFEMLSMKYTREDFIEKLESLIDEYEAECRNREDDDSIDFLCDIFDIAILQPEE